MRTFNAAILTAVGTAALSGCPERCDTGATDSGEGRASETGRADSGETGEGDSDTDVDSDSDSDADADTDSGGGTGETGEDVDTPWVDGDMGDCAYDGESTLASEFDGASTYFNWNGHGRAWGPLDIEGEGRICGATCTHGYAWVMLLYFDTWASVEVDLPADINYAGRPDGAYWSLHVGTHAGPGSDIGETITCLVNTSAGPWTATIEIRPPE